MQILVHLYVDNSCSVHSAIDTVLRIGADEIGRLAGFYPEFLCQSCCRFFSNGRTRQSKLLIFLELRKWYMLVVCQPLLRFDVHLCLPCGNQGQPEVEHRSTPSVVQLKIRKMLYLVLHGPFLLLFKWQIRMNNNG